MKPALKKIYKNISKILSNKQNSLSETKRIQTENLRKEIQEYIEMDEIMGGRPTRKSSSPVSRKTRRRIQTSRYVCSLKLV